MIFSELYSVYFGTVARLLDKAIDGKLSREEAEHIIQEHAFSESALTILPALREEKWQLLDSEFSTPLKHSPHTPLTLLEKRWLKALLMDPRVRLFDLSIEGLEDVEPLFTPEDYVVYDHYQDGDPYESAAYRNNVRTVLKALHGKYPLEIEMLNRNRKLVRMYVMPHKLEYSPKDDKFRLLTSDHRYTSTVNMARILDCRRYYGSKLSTEQPEPDEPRVATMLLTDQRNALERVMLHFAHFQKQAERIDDTHYRIRIHYDRNDETEMVIRILTFGSNLLVEEPQSLVNTIKKRLQMQKSCGLR